jgi:DamX protein
MSTEGSRPDSEEATAIGTTEAEADSVEEMFTYPELDQRLDLLLHLTENSDRIPLVLGEEGAGKTSLCQRIITLALPGWQVCRVTADPMLQPDQFFSQVGRGFSLHEDSQTVEGLINFFHTLRVEGKKAVVLVDDAHLLPVATIIGVLRLFERCCDPGALVKFVLFAEPEVENHLKTPQIQAMNLQMLHLIALPQLNAVQTAQFVHFLLQAEGIDGAALNMSDLKPDRLNRRAGGLPGRIEEQVRAVLSEGTATKEVGAGLPAAGLLADLPGPALVGVALVALVVVLTLVFQNEINAIFLGDEQGQESARPAVPVEGGVVELALPPESSIQAEIGLPVGERDSIEVADPVDFADRAGKAETVTESESVLDSKADSVPAEESPGEEIVVAPEAEGLPDVESDTGIAKVESPSAVTGAVVDSPAPAVETSVESPIASAPVRAADGLEVWVEKQPADAYTLQLIGVGNETAAKAYIARNNLGDKALIFSTTLNDAPWFAVIYGSYANRDAAAAARSKLPSGVKKEEAWPRSVASIRNALSAR